MTEPRGPASGDQASSDHALSDHAVEQAIGRLLQIGVAVAAAIIVVGGALLIAQHGGETPVYAPFKGEPAALTNPVAIVRGALALQSLAITQLGLVLLILTPVMRVALTWVAFLLQRDRLYVGVTSIVLVLLLWGLASGHG